MNTGKAFIGTSGWKYPHWDNTFYPADVKKQNQLKHFAKNFCTVELNNSFYRQPKIENYAAWKASVPPDFVFAVKAHRYFTHLKKLNVESWELINFLDRCATLGENLGPILFQLPPKWKLNAGRLETFLSALPKGYRYAFEFREPSWYCDEVYNLLTRYNCAFCIYHLGGHQSPIVATADFVYIRLHGPAEKYQGDYNDENLLAWATQGAKWLNEKKDLYVYFDNDQLAYAAFNAMAFKKMLGDE